MTERARRLIDRPRPAARMQRRLDRQSASEASCRSVDRPPAAHNFALSGHDAASSIDKPHKTCCCLICVFVANDEPPIACAFLIAGLML